jgi:multidrug efflux pump subunit AcrA (membrane-fusion protein)
MRILILLFLSIALFAREHIVQIEPFNIYHIKSSVAALVVEANDDLEGKSIKNKLVVKLDDRVDRAVLKSLYQKKRLLIKNIATEEENLKNLFELKEIKKRNYERIKNLKTKSVFEKEMRLSEYLSAKSAYLNQKSKIANLKLQLEDLKQNIAKTEDSVSKKSIILTGYVYKVYLKRGDFVTLGAPLVDIADISKAKVKLFLDKDEMKNIDKKSIYIDGKKVNKSFYVLNIIPSESHIAQYEAEIILEKPEFFGKLIKVEIK